MSKPRKSIQRWENAAKSITHECRDFITLGKDEREAGIVYLLRIYIPHLQRAVFKYGHTVIRKGTENKSARPFSSGLCVHNVTFGCDARREPSNIIVVMLFRGGAGKLTELEMKSLPEPLNKVPHRYSDAYHKEVHNNSPAVYDAFKAHCESLALNGAGTFWESDEYVLGDDGGETFGGEELPQ